MAIGEDGVIEKFAVSRDDSIYEAFPDVALTPSGRLVCVFAECTHHRDRGFNQVLRCGLSNPSVAIRGTNHNAESPFQLF